MKFITWLYIPALTVFLLILLNLTSENFQNIFPNDLISFMGFFLTALGFVFVIVQMLSLNEQIKNQKEQHQKDSEFKNFLEATKMLTSAENKNNTIAQISAMYLLYDYAKKHSNNIEQVIHVLNRFPVKVFYPKKNTEFYPKNITEEAKKDDIPFKDKKIISEWREKGDHNKQLASVALEIVKKLFAYVVENEKQIFSSKKIDLSGVIIFNFDIEIDVKKTNGNLLDIVKTLEKSVFLWCNFHDNSSNRKIYFSTKETKDCTISNAGKFNIGLSSFIHCNLNKCSFNYSNLWGVFFDGCNLTDTEFNWAECEGAEFINSKISVTQLDKMLFIGNNDFLKFRTDPELKYGVVYSKNKYCFSNVDEYDKFKDSIRDI